MSVWAILPCRAVSRRLYCKPLQRIGDRTILDQLINNIRYLNAVDGIVLAIAEGRANHCFIEFAESRGLPHVVGSEQNVLERVLQAVKQFDVGTMFRMTTECPFIYADGAREVIAEHVSDNVDFTTFLDLPLGTTYELIRTSLLHEMAATGDTRYQAPLSLYAREHQNRLRVRLLYPAEECRRPELNLAVDHPGQLIFCQRAFDCLKGRGTPVKIDDLIRYHDENPLVGALVESIHENVYAVNPDQTMARVW